MVDESMSRWYGVTQSDDPDAPLRHHPHVVSMPEKPESMGTEINVLCDGLGIILYIEVEESPAEMQKKSYGGVGELSGKAILRRLAGRYSGSGRTVVADSRFASVPAAVELKEEHNLDFVGLVKTAHKQFPLDVLRTHTPEHQGQSIAYTTTIGRVDLTACGYYDLKQMSFISTCKGSGAGNPAIRRYTEQTLDSDGQLKHVDVMVPRPALVERYFSHSNAVDHNNQLRQGSLNMESAIGTHRWWHRLFTTLVGMCVADAYLACRAFYRVDPSVAKVFRDFHENLTWDLVQYGSFLQMGGHSCMHAAAGPASTSHIDPHFDDPYHHRAMPLHGFTDYLGRTHDRLRCHGCHTPTTYYCELCERISPATLHGLCCPSHARSNCAVLHVHKLKCEK